MQRLAIACSAVTSMPVECGVRITLSSLSSREPAGGSLVKQSIAGYGQAEKGQVQHMVRALLSLSEIPRPDDAADALAIAICHLHSARLRSLTR